MASFGVIVSILVLLSRAIVSKRAPSEEEEGSKQHQNVEKSFFYWFMEAEHDPAAKPLILWLNGGPGCSSVGIGALQELGPFRVSRDSRQLRLNNYAWNIVTNLLFLESPIWTGFSYSNATDDGIYGDDIVGHYVPQLAEVITSKNKRSGVNRFIKLKGLIIGNLALDEETEYKGVFESAYYHSLISDGLFKQLQTCDLSKKKQTNECCSGYSQYDTLKDLNIDMYSLYTPTCPDEDPIRNTASLINDINENDSMNRGKNDFSTFLTTIGT